jgi:hypothetical protein
MIDEKKALAVAKSKKKGEKWVEEALPHLVEISKELKWKEEEMKKETTPIKEILKTMEEPYKETIGVLKKIGEALRERVMEEYKEREAIRQEGIGELVFPEVQSIEVEDLAKVDRKYLMVDMTRVKEDVKNGLTKIKGIKIGKKRTLQVRPWKE